jgi:hypothetical protein
LRRAPSRLNHCGFPKGQLFHPLQLKNIFSQETKPCVPVLCWCAGLPAHAAPSSAHAGNVGAAVLGAGDYVLTRIHARQRCWGDFRLLFNAAWQATRFGGLVHGGSGSILFKERTSAPIDI